MSQWGRSLNRAIFHLYLWLKTNLLWGAILGGIFVGGSYLAAMGAVETYVEKISRKYDFEYGQVRMWGSLGTAIAAFFAGRIFNLNPDYNFLIGSIAAIMALIILLTTKIDVTDTEVKSTATVKFKDIFEIFKLSNFWFFIIFILGVASINTIYDQQFPRYFAEQFATVAAGNKMYGYLNSLQTFLEVGMMFLAPKIVNKFGTRNSMLLVGILVSVRILLTSLVAGPVMITAVKLIQAFDMPLMYISIFKYINLNFESRLSSILYLVGYQFISQIGVVSLSTFMGKMYDDLGYRMTYLYLGLVVCVFVIIAFLTLNKDPQVEA